VISPLLANIYLHYVYDLWADQWRKREATGEVIVVRYAGDTIVGFQRQADAKRFLRDLRERLAKFGLALHPDKTCLIEFGRHAAEQRSARGLGKPETFDFQTEFPPFRQLFALRVEHCLESVACVLAEEEQEGRVFGFHGCDNCLRRSGGGHRVGCRDRCRAPCVDVRPCRRSRRWARGPVVRNDRRSPFEIRRVRPRSL
jgi:Reverse transcriptase (RNA-dependent DNA polymerase)